MVKRDQGKSSGISKVLEAYLERQKIYSKKGSIKNARSSINRLLDHFGEVEISDLAGLELDAFVSARRAQGVSNKTINGDLIILRAALNHALACPMPHRSRQFLPSGG